MMHQKTENTKSFFSKPQLVELPKGFPFFAFISAVELPEGCLPPSNNLKHRIVVGRGSTAEHAFQVTQMEAIERYCLQYTTLSPAKVSASLTFGDAKESCEASLLYLGHPDSKKTVRSIGSAAGDSFEEAGIRAVLELIERTVLERGGSDWKEVLLNEVEAISAHVEWLQGLGRTMHIKVHPIEGQIFVASAACTDFDGGRPTEGSAADVSIDDAVRRASEEAILSWRNMIQLEMNALPIQDFPENERKAVALYRGFEPSPYRGGLGLDRFDRTEGSHSKKSLCEFMEAILPVLGSGISLFDLTNEDIGIPVVRAVYS